MKKTIQYTSVVVGTILFMLCLYYIGIDDLISGLKVTNLWYFLAYLSTSFAMFIGYVIRWRVVLMSMGHNVSIFKLFNFRVAGFAVSYLTPSARLGGEPVRTYLLVKEGLPLEKSMSSVFVDKSLELSANTIMTIFGVLAFGFFYILSNQMKWILALTIIVITTLLVLFYWRIFRGKGIFTSLIKLLGLSKIKFFKTNFYKIRDSELEMTNFFLNSRRAFFITTLISFALWILMVFEFKFLLATFGFFATYSQVFFVMVAVGVAYIMPVPAALGVLEGTQVSLFKAFGKGTQYGFTVSIATRIRDMIWTLYGLVFLYHRGVIVQNLLKDAGGKIKVSERSNYFNKMWQIK